MNARIATALRIADYVLGGGENVGKHHAKDEAPKAGKVRTVRHGEAAFVSYESGRTSHSTGAKRCAHGSFRCKDCG